MPIQLELERASRFVLLSLCILGTFACGGGGAGAPLGQNRYANRLTIPTPQLKQAVMGNPYSCQLTATGGAPPLTWSVATGSLPPGISLSVQTGLLSGTPAKSGDFAVTFAATDSTLVQQQTAMAGFNLAVVTPPLVIVTPVLPGAVIGQVYGIMLQASGGTPPYVWALSEGSLPAGLQLDPLTGVLAGTPTSQGTFQFTIQVTDSSSPQNFAKLTFGSGRRNSGG